MEQVKWKLDKETLKKVGKGLLYAVVPAAGVAFFNYLGTIQVDNPYLASFIVWLVPTAVNFFKEWAKGGEVS